jgi:protein dithiol oxidoreductase (disulfide-forming)
MRRPVVVSIAIVVGLLVSACQRTPETDSAAPPSATAPASTPAQASEPIGSTATPPAASAGASSATGWTFGTNYRSLSAPQPTNVAPGKVEVVEVFWYACAHCFGLEPFLKDWKQSKANYIEFVKMPVIWHSPHRQHARLFYAIEALQRPDLHAKVFEEIHQKGGMLAAQTDEEARTLQAAFMRQNGVSQAQFDSAYDSFDVTQKIARAEQLTKRYEVDAVPRVILNGKYSTDIGMAGGQTQLLSLINDISAAEPR